MDDDATLKGDFDQFDTDGNGAIDRAEFGSLVEFLELGLSEAQTDEEFRGIDTDGNGQIDFSEFKVWWIAYQQS